MGNVYNRLILCKTLIARELACCKIFVRNLAFRKLCSRIRPTERRGGGGIPYLTRGLRSVSQVGGVNSYSKTIKNYSRKFFYCIMAHISSTCIETISLLWKKNGIASKAWLQLNVLILKYMPFWSCFQS